MDNQDSSYDAFVKNSSLDIPDTTPLRDRASQINSSQSKSPIGSSRSQDKSHS